MTSSRAHFKDPIGRDPLALLFITLLCAIVLASLLGPFILTHSPDAQNLARRLETPSVSHWLGTDSLGRDLTARVLQGTRISLIIGVSSTFFSLIVGTLTGALAGFFRGKTEAIILAVIDFFGTFPPLLLAMLASMAVGRGIAGILVSICLTAWLQHARIVRVQVIQVSQLEYTESARALGVGPLRILWNHILPNIKGPIFISVSAQIPANIMAESFLSFLGLGVQPPLASLGALSSEGARMLRSHPHLFFAPGLVLFMALLSAQYLGDWIRDQSIDTSRK